MNRTQKKCFIAATGSHLLLVVTLFIGPGFFTSTSKLEDSNVLTFIPEITTDEKVAGGGHPNGGSPPAPAPQPPQPEPPKSAVAEKVEKVEPPKPAAKETKPEKPETESLEPAPKRAKPQVSLKTVVRKNTTATTKANPSKSQSTDDSPAKDQQAFNSTVKNLRSGLSAGTTIDMPRGPGGGGAPYANFYDGVKKVYSDAWVVPDGVTDDNATVTASVTIARSGEVLDTSIVVRSGNREVDESVAATLRRVRFAVPLPASASEDKRTVKIKFNVRAQRMLG